MNVEASVPVREKWARNAEIARTELILWEESGGRIAVNCSHKKML